MEDFWIWPAVYFVELDGLIAGALVYQHPSDMFWGSYQLVPSTAESPILSRGFWDTTFIDPRRSGLVNAWNGGRPTTFVGGNGEADEPVSHLSFRSLFPSLGVRDPAQVEHCHRLRPLIEDVVPLGRQQALREILGVAPLVGHLSILELDGALSLAP